MALGILLSRSSSRSGFNLQTKSESLAWSYTPSSILVLLGYAIESAGSRTQALSGYVALQIGSVTGQRLLLFKTTDRSASKVFYRSYWQSINWTFFAVSIVVIIYPAIKVAAAGLYMNYLGKGVFAINIEIDQSLVTNLDKVFVSDTLRTVLLSTSVTLARWTLESHMHFTLPSGTGGSLIFSNLTSNSLSSSAGKALDLGGSLSVNVPAIQVNINCSAYNAEDFQVIREEDVVRVLCKSHGCRRYFPEMMKDTTDHEQTFLPLWRDGFNLSAYPGGSYAVFISSQMQNLTDPEDYGFAPINGVYMKIDDYGPNQMSPTHQLNLTPNAIASYSCVRSLDKVNVNVTFTRTIQSNLEGTSLLSANIATFDKQSMSPANDLPPYDKANVTINYPSSSCASSANMTCESSTDWITPDGAAWLKSPPDIMPYEGSSTFLDVTAATQLQYELSDAPSMERLFEPENLIEAAKEAYIIFTIQFINQLRSIALEIGNNTVHRTATVSQQSLRAVQSRNITIVLIILLDIVLACIIFALWRVPSKPVVAKAPNSIAAQASLLAGSNLVHRLREKGVDSVMATNIWNEEVFSLGWWDPNERQIEEGMREPRWGIDIGVARLRNTLDAGPKSLQGGRPDKAASTGRQAWIRRVFEMARGEKQKQKSKK